jgi:hypothetical protein
MSSLESAVREIRRPGPLESCWNWRWELGILAATAGLSGLTAADLFAARQVLAVACWATDVRVIPSVQHAHRVTLEAIRNQYQERTRPTASGWPYSRHVEVDATDDPEEPATAGVWSEPAVRSE